MDIINNQNVNYLYTYASYEDERDLVSLEMRSLFGKDSQTGVIESAVKINPSRSPFIKERLEIILEALSLEELVSKVQELTPITETYKVKYIKRGSTGKADEAARRRRIEKEIGLKLKGVADIHNPKQVYGVITIGDRWLFGKYEKSESVWFRHQQKPHSYSTALNTRVARAVVNIAIPNSKGIKAIDPCCGIGTVLVEALSMGIDIVGSDRNPLILKGTRENIAHFGYSCEVKKMDIRDIDEQYDVAIIDLPYNLCSVITEEEQLEMIQCARSFATKVVVVTVEPIDKILAEAGFSVVDR
ncbi:MAG: methyltransferase domain-containing protein, partial [Bacillus sp. (in: firmicutes)]